MKCRCSPRTIVTILPRPFSEDELRTALRETASRARRDAINGLAEWLNQHPSHQLHDLTIRYFVEQAVLDDPAAAAAWTKKITNPALRGEAEQFLNR